MSKELETRNQAMYQMYAAGKSMQTIADTYGVTRQRAAQIIARYTQDAAVTDDESRSLHRAQLEGILSDLVSMYYEVPPPMYDVKGNMLIDENGEPVRDRKAKLDTADQVRKISESLRRQDALDLPRRKQLAEDEAMRQMKDYLASLPKAQVEELHLFECHIHQPHEAEQRHRRPDHDRESHDQAEREHVRQFQAGE